MLNQWIRVLHSDNGVLVDRSLASGDRSSTFTLPITTDEDYLYVGQYFPFNNLYFAVDTANTNACIAEVDIWSGTEWKAAVDVLDSTSDSGVSMAQSGVIQWEIDRDESGWGKIADPTDEGSALGFETEKIYDLYWVRIGFSATLSAGSLLKRVTYRFCTDADIIAKAPEINSYLTSWGDGSQADWEPQCIEASEQVLIDLKSRSIALTPGQILRFDDVNTACAYKAISLIYDGVRGEDALLERDKKHATYRRLIKNAPVTVDTNQNAKVDSDEQGINQGSLFR